LGFFILSRFCLILESSKRYVVLMVSSTLAEAVR